MYETALEGMRAILARVNRGRLGLAGAGLTPDLAVVEREIEEIWQPSVRLAIYGTLAPGKANHHHIAALGGEWHDATVRGKLGAVPCGVHEGLPAIVLDSAAPPFTLKLLVCDRLPDAWERLDAFEGAEMQRLLVLLEGLGGIAGVANIYALRGAMIERLG